MENLIDFLVRHHVPFNEAKRLVENIRKGALSEAIIDIVTAVLENEQPKDRKERFG